MRKHLSTAFMWCGVALLCAPFLVLFASLAHNAVSTGDPSGVAFLVSLTGALLISLAVAVRP